MIRAARALSRRAFALGCGALACQSTPSVEGRTVATLWFTYGGRNRQVLESLVKRFNESQQDVYVRAVFQGDYFEGLAKLRTAIAAKAAPTLSHVVGEVVPYLADAGVLQPLDGYPHATQLGVVEALGQTGSWIGGADRALVCLPFNRSTPIAYVNGAIFEQLGLRPPSTWQELVEVAKAASRRGTERPERFGFGCPIDWWFWTALVGQAGGKVVEDDGRVTLGGDAGVEAIELWQRMVHQDNSMKPPPGRDYNAWEQTNQDFLSGRTAMIWTSTAFLKYLEENAPFPVVAAPLPRHRRRAVPTGGTHWVMLAQAPTEQKQAAWAFLRFMHQPDQVIEWATRTGYMPVTRGGIERLKQSGYYDKHPNDRVAVEQLAVALPWPWSPELFRVQREIVQPRLEGAVLGRDSARAVIDSARAAAEPQR
ncbi:MAG: ABC transporter substrate-binding protein [Polyangiaceae bacterium]